MSEAVSSSGSVIPPEALASAVRDSVIANGTRSTATRLGLSLQTTSRIAGRLPAHRASVERAARRMGIEVGE